MNARDDQPAEQKRYDDGSDDGTAPQLAVRIEHNRRCRVAFMLRLLFLFEEFALACVSHSFIMHFVGVLHRPSPSMCFFFCSCEVSAESARSIYACCGRCAPSCCAKVAPS